MAEHSFNPRVAAMKPSATLAMSSRAKALRRDGRPIIELSAGEPDFDTPRPVAEAAIAAIREGFTHYTDNAGMYALREAICRKLRRENGLEYEPEDVLVSNGAKQSVAMAVAVLCREGDEVLIPAPYWVSYPEMARFAGAEPVVVPTSVESGYLLTPSQLEAALTPRTRAVILCSPSNPTGGVYAPAALEALAEVLARHPGVYVISDEIYEHIRYDIDHLSFARLDGMRNRTVTVNGFSKAYAMTGWRLGYLAADRPVVKACATVQSQFTSAPSSISQRAGVAALDMGPEPVDDMVRAFRVRRDFVLGELSRHEGVRCPRPDGAFYVFPNVKRLVGRRTASGRRVESAEDFCFHLLEDYDLALVQGSAFGDPDGIRLSYAASMADLEEAMRRFALAVESLS